MMRSVPGDPERLGGYWLAGRLGAGRHGVVYDAYDDKGRRFAVRVPRGPAPRLRPVTHPHLAGVLEVRPGYVVSEFAAGPSLREALARRGPYAGEELIALATAVASALACLHAAGLVHGDLRPGKVLLADGGPKVICPGGSGSIGATRTYLAPEAVTGRQADAPGDVFAWGGLVLFAATGEDPFRGDSLGEVMHRLLSCDPDLTVLPPPLRDLVASALSKDPAARPSAAALLLPTDAQVPALPGPPTLGEVAEDLYASLTPAEQHRLRDLLIDLAPGQNSSASPPPRSSTSPAQPAANPPANPRPQPSAGLPAHFSASLPQDGHDRQGGSLTGVHEDEAVLARLLETGLLVRPSVAVPPVRTEVGTLVAVTGDRLAPATAALFHAWPRLRGWLDRPREETRSWARACLPQPRARRRRLPAVALVAAFALAISVVTVARDTRRTMQWLGETTSRVAPILAPDPPPTRR